MSVFKMNIIGTITMIVIGTGIFFGLNYYEQQNNCTLGLVFSFKLISCIDNASKNHKTNNPKDIDCSGHGPFKPDGCFNIKKPLILLYPTSDSSVQVSLEYNPGFSTTFPEYNKSITGWSVMAYPDGTLFDKNTKQDTYGLFWEGNPSNTQYDLSKGFIVQGSEIRDFLYSKLTEIGLNTKEKSDFIMYWYPKLQEYPYIQITFAGKDYTDIAKLDISPKPDSLLRVFMVVKPLREFKEIPEQKLQKFERKGFSVVEWGGTFVE